MGRKIELSALVERADAGFVVVDAQGQIAWTNRIFLDNFANREMDPAELLGKGCNQALCNKIRPCQECPAAAGLAGEEPGHRELRLWIGDRYHHVYATAIPLRDDAGVVDHTLVMLQDLSGLKLLQQSEETLHASEERFRSIFGKVAAGMATTRVDGSFLQVNPAFCAMLGYTESELLRKNFSDVCHEEDAPIFRGQFDEVLEQHRGEIDVDNRYIRCDGATVWAHTTAVWQYDGDGRPSYCIQLIQDIDQGKRAQAALEESRREYAELIDSLETIVWEADPRTLESSFVSRQAETILGYPIDQWLTQPRFWRNHVHTEDVERAVDACTRAVAGGKGTELEYRMMSAGGGTVWLRHTISVVLDGDEVVKLRGVMMDVTERKQAELALARSEEQLRQSQTMESIGRLAGGIAHDFNNLLTAITGYSDFLLKGLGANHPMQREARQIHEAARSAAELTGQLLALSRQQVMQPKVINLNQAVAEAEQMLRRVIGEDIELVVVSGMDLGAVTADPGQLHQVILNLAINARDAMPEGGKLTIQTTNIELDEHDAAGHAGLEPGSYILLAIADSGAGMDKQTLAQIFEPFFSTKGKSEGTGLGLSTVYGIVKQSGGQIEVYSEPGHGTTFKIYLPAAPLGRASVVEVRPEPVVGSQGSETILLVEDDKIVRELAGEILGGSGYRVVEAENGVEALSVLGELDRQIDLIVTDVVMPRMGGPDLAEEVAERRPELKFLFLSGYSDAAIEHRGLLDPDVNFLQKPFTPDGLTHMVRRLLDG